jgi:hypothetical protein
MQDKNGDGGQVWGYGLMGNEAEAVNVLCA